MKSQVNHIVGYNIIIFNGKRGLMVESWTHNQNVVSLSLGPAGIVGGGVNVQLSLHLQYHDEVPLSKPLKPQLLPGRRRINSCPLLRVCVHCCVCAPWMGKCRARIPEYGSPYSDISTCKKAFQGGIPKAQPPADPAPPPTKKEAKDMIFHHRTWLYFYNEIQLKWTTRLNKLTIYTHCKCWPRPISNILCLLLFLQAFIVLCCCLLRRF